MKENVGRTDQRIRSIVGPFLILAGYRTLKKRHRRTIALAAMIGGALILESAITRTCPINDLIGIDTRESLKKLIRDLISVEASVLDSFKNMVGFDPRHVGQVRDGSGYFQHTMAGPGGKAQPFHRAFENL
jgi:hypothetical protein